MNVVPSFLIIPIKASIKGQTRRSAPTQICQTIIDGGFGFLSLLIKSGAKEIWCQSNFFASPFHASCKTMLMVGSRDNQNKFHFTHLI
ncbi:MAG: hypothetical protein QG657_2920 [Acidobacteriota bacterium]|nr:hypothetical protein [Acidobacteriota bacterium]